MGEPLNIPDGPGWHDAAGVRGIFVVFAAFLLAFVAVAVGARNGWQFRPFDFALLAGAAPLGVIGIGLLKGRRWALDAYRLCLSAIAAWVLLYGITAFAGFFFKMPGRASNLPALFAWVNSPSVMLSASFTLLIILACGGMFLANVNALRLCPPPALSPGQAAWLRWLVGGILLGLAVCWVSSISAPESMSWLLGFAYQSICERTGSMWASTQIFIALALPFAICTGVAGLALLTRQPWASPAAIITVGLQAVAVALLNGGCGDWGTPRVPNMLPSVPTALIATGYSLLWITAAAFMMYALMRMRVAAVKG